MSAGSSGEQRELHGLSGPQSFKLCHGKGLEKASLQGSQLRCLGVCNIHGVPSMTGEAGGSGFTQCWVLLPVHFPELILHLTIKWVGT